MNVSWLLLAELNGKMSLKILFETTQQSSASVRAVIIIMAKRKETTKPELNTDPWKARIHLRPPCLSGPL